jgi:hypothetical protein
VHTHGLGGRTIVGYGIIDHHDPIELRACIAYVGLQLPLTARRSMPTSATSSPPAVAWPGGCR